MAVAMALPSIPQTVETKEALWAAEAWISHLIEQADVTEEIDIDMIQRARRIIAESRALIAEVEKLLQRKPSHSDLPITPPQDPAALT
jgi:hypothetical protein